MRGSDSLCTENSDQAVSMEYRREIDGLRALAVLPVILFHAGFVTFSGGFVGVDVFFVISGYLITTIILHQLGQGTFSLAGFYERRARRILPALYFVMLCTLPFAWFTMVPVELIEYSKSLIAVPLFVSNVVFWLDAGYFQTASELKPLLHTWSLAVEEQYYVLFPLFMLLAWRWCKKWLGPMLLVVALASLIVAQWASQARPSFAFYMLPTRGFEILIGALIALSLNQKYSAFERYRAHPIYRPTSESGSLCGLALIIYAIFAFNKSTPSPSFHTLIPTLGTGLIIVFASQHTIVGKLLGWKPLVGIGLISYSAYLWHQPLLVFARLISIDHPSTATLLLLCVLSLVAGFLSWHYVEKPFKHKNRVSRANVLKWSLLLTGGFVLTGMIGVRNHGFPGRIAIPAEVASSIKGHEIRKECDLNYNWIGTNIDFCNLGNSAEKKISIAIFGDSHSIAILPVFDAVGKELSQKYTHIGVGGCPPLMGVDVARGHYAPGVCENLAQREYDFVKSNGIKNVFLVGRWSLYTDGDKYGHGVFYLTSNKNSRVDKATSRINFAESLKATVEKYQGLGARVFVMSQVPQQNVSGASLYTKLYWRNIADKTKVIKSASVSRSEHRSLQAFNRSVIQSVQKDTGFTFVDLDDLFCDDEKCHVGDDARSKYLDENHLSIPGAMSLRNVIRRLIADK